VATKLVLTVIGRDQPGIVEAVSQVVAAHDGSWESSRMARLSGSFAGILEVQVPARNAAALAEGLRGLEQRGMRVSIEGEAGESHAVAFRVLQLELIGQDRPGIIRDISSALAAIEVNVVELSTGCSSAPMSGEMLFRASAQLHHPTSRAVDELRETLEKIAADLMVDITLDEHDV
jgi:glycine cleavage system regulatory protein